MTHSLKIINELRPFGLSLYQVIVVKIRVKGGKFAHRGAHPLITVSDGTVSAKSFVARISKNQRELHGIFPTDGFTGLTGLVDIVFGYDQLELGRFRDIDLTTEVVSLEPELGSVGAPMGTTTILSSL